MFHAMLTSMPVAADAKTLEISCVAPCNLQLLVPATVIRLASDASLWLFSAALCQCGLVVVGLPANYLMENESERATRHVSARSSRARYVSSPRASYPSDERTNKQRHFKFQEGYLVQPQQDTLVGTCVLPGALSATLAASD